MKEINLSNISKSIFLIAVILILGCSKGSEPKKYKIGFSQCISTDDWRKSMDHEMKVEASLNAEIDLTIFQANGDIKLQNSQIEFMLSSGFDVIIVSPLRSEPLVPIIEKAFDKGVPIIIVDRKINSQKFTAYIGANNMDVGRNAANYIASQNEKEINVLEIKGGDDSSPVLERHSGFNQIVSNEPKITVCYSIKDGDVNRRIPQILDSLNVIPINYVYAFNDEIAYNTWKIAKSKGVEKNIKFIGVDGLNGDNNGIQLVQSGILAASILYPTGGDEAIKIAMKILRNENVPKNNILSTTIIDHRNAEIMKNQYDKIKKHQNDIEIQQQKIKKQEETYITQSKTLKLVLGLLIISFILITVVIYSLSIIRRKKRQLEVSNKKILVQRDQIKASNNARLNFFTGLSHEFKTPITLILSSIESIIEDSIKRDFKLKNELGLIFNNSKRLLRLINQLLDFRKVEDRKFILRASETNIFNFTNSIYKDFEREALKHNIDFQLHSNNEDLLVYIDRNLMDKVFFNLLSNAFKFTPSNGKITIDIIDEKKTNFVHIHFKDSGIGIPESELKNVFKPFFQGSNNNNPSSGIGLHISKEFIDLHKGKIEIKSNNGVEIIITLYKGKTHLNSNQIVFESDNLESPNLNFITDYDDDFTPVILNKNESERFSILIIEDNSDLVKFLRNKLSQVYEIHESDGHDGIEKAFEIIPDIIICDVNLPIKNGFEICEILKKDLRTSHIPTIILTALSNKESYIKGLESGADLYLTKPFSLSILFQSVKTLLYNREKLRYYYINNIHKLNENHDFIATEQDFLHKMNAIIGVNLDNSNFTVEILAEELGISRVQLYRKIKAILDIKVSDYIQNIRLEKAEEMLKNNLDLSISEIAYSTGFSSQTYFSTSFKVKFGVTPKRFRDKL
ncbi:substrate-binding domain-containing protein [Mariniflexile gromovii]|uniref:histidine kinase n=1 Tax=Mariniflexile gromovii TaxID=362523 RepID=A0ABS4BPY6_9FLAO|nr:substrate-binding domain-containing protein [Mariniflexile gromovii]MBP0902649.1 substrate-binding domain-containing protein [Mariniflexile gromovii]